MKLRRVLLAVLVAFVAISVAPPPSAHAGGPTSVLMVNPNTEEARAAYYSDSAYSALAAAVGEGQTGPAAPPPGLARDGGEDVRLTWLVHDMQIWRIDRIHLTSADGMWIETVVDHTGGGQMLERPAHWHRAADTDGLLAALSAAGLLGDTEVAPTGPSGADAEATVPAPPATPVPAAVGAGLVGLVLGAAGTLVGVRARRRTPADRPERVTLSG
jgi:hypothetical protein